MQSLNLQLPKIIFGTSSLGNLYSVLPFEKKMAIVKEYVDNMEGIGLPMFDSAGKYGAGLSLEVLGECLEKLSMNPKKVLISNKLAWVRTPLLTPEPTFEPGVWKDLKFDAAHKISYEGILECYYQGIELLGNKYFPQFVSVHDPDEFLAKAKNESEEASYFQEVINAYRALEDLKKEGKVAAIGVGSKDWKTIRKISEVVNLDWVMIANSLTLHSHPKELINFVSDLHSKGKKVINSAVFNGGFLTGSNFYNYKEVLKNTPEGEELFKWRDSFFSICKQFNLAPAEACVQFGLSFPGIESIALNTSRPEMVKYNIEMATKQIPASFWSALVEAGLLEENIAVALK